MLYVLQKQSPKVFYKNGVLKNFTKFIGKKCAGEYLHATAFDRKEAFESFKNKRPFCTNLKKIEQLLCFEKMFKT